MRSAAVDAIIAATLKAGAARDFVAAVPRSTAFSSPPIRVPLYHLPVQWVARWRSIRHPAATSLYGYLPEVWWREPFAKIDITI